MRREPVDDLGDDHFAVLRVCGVVGRLTLQDELLRLGRRFVEADGMVGRSGGVVFDGDDHEVLRPVRYVDGFVGHHGVGGGQWDLARDLAVDIRFDRCLPPFGGRDHDVLAGMDQLALPGRDSPSPVLVESLEILVPLVFTAHPLEPVGPVGDGDLGDGTADPVVVCGQQNGIPSSGPT